MTEESRGNVEHEGRRRGKASSRLHSHGNERGKSKNVSRRRGLRIFIGTANLGNALPDHDSLSAWLPRHGRTRQILHPHVKSSSIIEGVSKEHWNHVDPDGKLEIIAIGFQESVPGSNVLTMTGLTAKLTGTTVKERNAFSKAFGELGKPIDVFQNKMNEVISTAVKDTQAGIGGTKKLKEMVTGHIGEDYELMTQYQRGEMLFFLFVRKNLAVLSSVASVMAQNCGLGTVLANKGGIATNLTIGSTRLSFLSVHLTAGEGLSHYEQRNANVEEILRGTSDPTLSVHHAFVLGDLNYRIRLPPSSRGIEITHEETMHVCQRIIGQKDWATLNEHDELRRALQKKQILVGFKTPPMRTFPTFKCERREGNHFVDQRVPSYTDRILWKSIEDTRNVEALIYEPITKFSSSDHKPVRGLFFLPDRPRLELDPEKTALNVTLTGLKCKSLKPAANLMRSDIDTYLKFHFEPTSLDMKYDTSKRHTETVLTTDRPSWPREEIKFLMNVSSKDEITGAYLHIECIHQTVMSAESRLGTVIIDMEHLIRKSLGVQKWKYSVERHFLRNGKEVGQLFCSMGMVWGETHTPKSQATEII